MKRKLAGLLILICLMALPAGCGASSASSTSGGTGAAASASAMDGKTTMDAAAGDYGGIELTSTAQTDHTVRTSDADRENEAKRIYTANLSMETTAFDDAAKGLAALVDELDGWMQSSSVDYGGSGYRYGNYTARIPQEKFDQFISRAGKLCHVVSSYSNVEDVSEAYYDTAGRLGTQQTKLKRLQTLLSQAKDMEDMITIESAISDTENQIESLSGDLKHYDSQIDYATVTLSLNEVYQLSNVEQPAAGFSGRIAEALSSGAHAFLNFLQGTLVLLAYAWVWMLLIAAVLTAGLFMIRRKRKTLVKTGQKPLPEKRDDKTE